MPIKNKQYHKIKIFERTRLTKQKCVEYKGGKCEICGYSKCQGSLHFHHKDPSQKDFSISQKSNVSFDNLKQEIDKCVLLCANCHGELHWNEALERVEAEKKICASTPKTKVNVSCDQCGSCIFKWPSALREHNFCSVKCRVKFKSTWPDDIEVAEMFTNMTILEVGNALGKSYNAAKKKRAVLIKNGLIG